jgi:hypothetical protein
MCVVGPQRDHEAVSLVDERPDPRLKRTHRALRFGEPLRKVDFELCDLMRERCDSGKDVARQQAHRELVRVAENDRVVDCQTKC